jgi:hypothetical protein
MLHGEGPFAANTDEAVYRRLRTEAPYWAPELSKHCIELLQGFLKHEPTDRLGCEKLGGPATVKAQAWFQVLIAMYINFNIIIIY